MLWCLSLTRTRLGSFSLRRRRDHGPNWTHNSIERSLLLGSGISVSHWSWVDLRTRVFYGYMRRKDRLTHRQRQWMEHETAAEQQLSEGGNSIANIYLNDIYFILLPTQAIPGNDTILVVLRKSNVAFSMLHEIQRNSEQRVVCVVGGTEMGEYTRYSIKFLA